VALRSLSKENGVSRAKGTRLLVVSRDETADPCDFHLWEHVKGQAYQSPMSQSILEFPERISQSTANVDVTVGE
jgi:hypothetical protein